MERVRDKERRRGRNDQTLGRNRGTFLLFLLHDKTCTSWAAALTIHSETRKTKNECLKQNTNLT